MPRSGSSKSGIKLREIVSRCSKVDKTVGFGTFWPGRGELAEAILLFVKRWPNL